jgi:hypothetical protein
MYDSLDRYVAMISKEISESQTNLLHEFEDQLASIRSLSTKASAEEHSNQCFLSNIQQAYNVAFESDV